jgi:hypothetical protein
MLFMRYIPATDLSVRALREGEGDAMIEVDSYKVTDSYFGRP